MTRAKKTIAALSLAGMAVCGAAFAVSGTRPRAVDAKVVRAAESGYCVIPAWRSANYSQIKLSASEGEEFDIETQIEEFVQVNFRVEIPLIRGPLPKVVPNTASTAQTAQEASECPISEAEIIMMAKVMKRECGGLVGIYGGVSAKARQAAVAWCALNRLDSEDPYYPDTLAEVLTQSGAFAWIPNTYVDPELLDLARDVVNRWWRERNGETDVGRTLPKEYLFFAGRNGENHFRDKYSGNFTYWDWSMPDPYMI